MHSYSLISRDLIADCIELMHDVRASHERVSTCDPCDPFPPTLLA
jgi:dihydroxyacid dehydratase/phosphogluconate dehydratase